MDLLPATGEVLPPLSDLPSGARALVVEDPACERDSRTPVRSGLQRLGLEAYCAPSTQRAGRILDRVPVDLLILELGPTAGQARLEWFASVRTQHPDLLLIVAGDRSGSDLERRCDALGAAACLAEPVSLRTLRRCIERAFAFRRQRQEIKQLERQLAAAQAAGGAGASVGGHETEHRVADVWFAIFEQLLAAARHASLRAAGAGRS